MRCCSPRPTAGDAAEAVLHQHRRRHRRRRPRSRYERSPRARARVAVVTTQAAEKIYRSLGDAACDRQRRRGRRRRAGSNGCRRRPSCSTARGCAAQHDDRPRGGAGFWRWRSLVFGRAACGERCAPAMLRRSLACPARRQARLGRTPSASTAISRRCSTRPALLDGVARVRHAASMSRPTRAARLDAARERSTMAPRAGGDAWSTACWSRASLRADGAALRATIAAAAHGCCATAPRRRASGAAERTRMNLTPREKDKLLIAMAAMVARTPPRARRQAQLSRRRSR